ncbi:MAG TPA: hypothetical protein VKM55_08950 [Candidatus Lokiarchaeia archaeon]|nr:hypothetical protein [Candidatus Lokiarchaeia archaeon]
MSLMAVVSLDITHRDLEDVWENLQSTLEREDGIEPIAMGITFESYDIHVIFYCDEPENLNRYIIHHLRSLKGVTETTVYFLTDMESIVHEGMESEPGLDGIILIDVECGKEDAVFHDIMNVGPEEDKTFTKFIANCMHSEDLDMLVGFKGQSFFMLDKLFSNIRIVDGVTDIQVIMFTRFIVFDYEKSRFTWYL